MGLTRISVHQPIVALAVTITLVIFGLYCYASLGMEKNPRLTLPVVSVTASYPGAGARTVEEQVTRRLEDAIAGLGNVKRISSVSQIGFVRLTVEFTEGIDVNVALNDVQQRVSSTRKDLPSEVEEPAYSKLDYNDIPVVYLAVTGGGQADPVQLYRLADEVARPRLEATTGVGRVEIEGGRLPEVQVEVQPERLRAYGIPLVDLTAAIQGQFLSTAGGQLSGGRGEGTRRSTVRIDSRTADVAAMGALPVGSGEGRSTYLRNLATVYLGGKEPEVAARANGLPAAGLLVYKQSGANITRVAEAVALQVAGVNASMPAGYRLDLIYDGSAPVVRSISGVQEELLLATIITGLVLFFFLHSLRATIIVLVAIPVSLLLAVITMRLNGLTLNIITLIGMVTAIGVLVDDSIVVLENIVRHLEHGQDSRQAALDGRSEIGLAAIAITLVDVAVWGPIIFITGVTGAFLRNFAIVMVSSTLASLLVSFTLTPLLTARWMTAAEDRSLLARIAGSWEWAYEALERWYRRVLHWSLGHRPVVLVAALAIFLANGVILQGLGSEFLPVGNYEMEMVIAELPAGTALEASRAVAERWDRALLDRDRFPEVQAVYLVAGQSESERDPRFISALLNLGPPHARTRPSGEIARAAADVAAELWPGLQARVTGLQAGPAGQPVQVRVYDDDLDELSQLADRVQASLGGLPELLNVSNNLAAAPEIVVRPDWERLTDLGLSAAILGDAIRTAYHGQDVGHWIDATGRERTIRLRLPSEAGPETIPDLPLLRRGDQMLTAGQVAGQTVAVVPTRIMRVDRHRVAIIGAEPNRVPLGTATRAATQALNGLAWPARARWDFAGQGEEQESSFGQLGAGLGFSVILIYLVLTVLYRSWIYPLIILSALPLATVGAFLGLMAFGQTLSVPSFIGLIALMGLVGKNSILLVDRANELRRQGLDRRAALEQAGPGRLRPILMTSAVLVLSMLPVAMRLSSGGEERSPLGAVLVGGMSSSTLLSLLLVPVGYTYFDGFQTLLGRLAAWRPRAARARGDRKPAAIPTPQSPPGEIVTVPPIPEL